MKKESIKYFNEKDTSNYYKRLSEKLEEKYNKAVEMLRKVLEYDERVSLSSENYFEIEEFLKNADK